MAVVDYSSGTSGPPPSRRSMYRPPSAAHGQHVDRTQLGGGVVRCQRGQAPAARMGARRRREQKRHGMVG